jgi:hypothetical protein
MASLTLVTIGAQGVEGEGASPDGPDAGRGEHEQRHDHVQGS